MADSALAVAQCSHLALDVGSPGLRQLANAAEQGQRASSSNPLRLFLISHRAVTECGHSRRFYLYSPGTVQYTNDHRAMCFLHYYVRSIYVTHPHWWIFSGGSAPSSASRDDPLDKQPGSPV